MMKPTDFPEANVVFAKDQPEYNPLPSNVSQDNQRAVTTCWQLSTETIFRGLRVDGQGWAYGRPYVASKYSTLCTYMAEGPYAFKNGSMYGPEVRPETVGPFVGIIDKHGARVFDGDKIKVTRVFGFHSDLMSEWKVLNDLDTINGIGTLFSGIVVMDIRRGLMLKREDCDYAEPIFSRHYQIKKFLDFETIEVTGNIHTSNGHY